MSARRNIPETFSFQPFEGLKKMIEGRGIKISPKTEVRQPVLPKKEEASYKVDASMAHPPIFEPENHGFPYLNIAIISSMFLGALISAALVDNTAFKKLLNIVSLASMITLLVYVSAFFFSKHFYDLKKNALEMTDAMKKKEAQKKDAIQDIIGHEDIKK